MKEVIESPFPLASLAPFRSSSAALSAAADRPSGRALPAPPVGGRSVGFVFSFSLFLIFGVFEIVFWGSWAAPQPYLSGKKTEKKRGSGGEFFFVFFLF